MRAQGDESPDTRGYDQFVAGGEQLSLELDADVASLLRRHAAEAQLSEGEVVALALRAFDLRALLAQIRGRSDLSENAAIALTREELQAARADAPHRAA